ncbi:MAG TPA: DNA polymerase III subunit gamma/tau, partial [Pseudoneobacillus sp.]|nr:DNA polymerase III subunit gamma/tau [Pseudoneobacillus sp.]
RAAEGGMRDALSLLDQAISFSEESVTMEDALTVTGSVSQNLLNRLATAILNKDVASALETVGELLSHGKDPVRFIEDFILYYRDMLLYKAAPNLEETFERVMLDAEFQELAEKITSSQIYQLIDILNKTQQEMRWTNHPRIFLEVAIVKLTQTEAKEESGSTSAEVGQLIAKVNQLEKELKFLKENGSVIQQESVQAAQPKTQQRSNRKGFQAPVGRINEILKHATKPDLQQIKGQWGQLIAKLVQNQMRSQAALLNDAEPVAASQESVIIKFKYEIHCQMAMENSRFVEAISHTLYELTNNTMSIVGVPEDQWLSIRESFIHDQQSDPDQTNEQQEEEPFIAEAKKLFGSELVEIKD